MAAYYVRKASMYTLPLGGIYVAARYFSRVGGGSSGSNSGGGGSIKAAPYGSWESPLTTLDMVSSSISLSDLRMGNSDTDNNVYFIEQRPNEKGRMCIVGHNPNTNDKIDMIPNDINSRSRVHEYGGASYCVNSKNNSIISCNFSDQLLYNVQGSNNNNNSLSAKEITSKMPNPNGLWKYSDMSIMNDNVICVREEDIAKERKPCENINNIVSINIETGKQDIICQGHDFYMSPKIDKNNKFLAYIAWDFPNMPWDNTRLYIKNLLKDNSNESKKHQCVANGCSILSPKWDLNGENLYYISDETGYWNIYQYSIKSNLNKNICNQSNMEFGRPAWTFGKNLYEFINNNIIIAVATDSKTGHSKLLCINTDGKDINNSNNSGEPMSEANMKRHLKFSNLIKEIKLDNDIIADIDELVVDRKNQIIYILGGSPTNPKSIFEIKYRLHRGNVELDNENVKIVKSTKQINEKTGQNTIDKEYISVPKHIEYKTEPLSNSNNNENNNTEYSYAYVYYPKNPKYKGTEDELPPLLVMTHGGPTGATSDIYNEFIQFYTTRGWVVADVNYRGSSGYGTKYRNKLRSNWGITDVQDVCNIAKYLVDKKRVDSNKLCIRGGSAGGFTVLATLTSDKYNNVFKVGCSRYGVADLSLLDAETHKFESKYLDMLICDVNNDNVIDTSDKLQRYFERSPINNISNLKIPCIFLQGKEDKIVLPNQAEMMYNALIKNNVTTSLEMFEGEQHGFRQKENIVKAFDYEYAFYCQMLNIPLSKSDEQNMQKPNITWATKNESSTDNTIANCD